MRQTLFQRLPPHAFGRRLALWWPGPGPAALRRSGAPPTAVIGAAAEPTHRETPQHVSSLARQDVATIAGGRRREEYRAPTERPRAGGGGGNAAGSGSVVDDGGDAGVLRDSDLGAATPPTRRLRRLASRATDTDTDTDMDFGAAAAGSGRKSSSSVGNRENDIARDSNHGHLRNSGGGSGGSGLHSDGWSQEPRKNGSRGAERLMGPWGVNSSGGGGTRRGPGPAADRAVAGASSAARCDGSGSVVGLRGGSRDGRAGRGGRRGGAGAGGGGRAGRGRRVGSAAASSSSGMEEARRINQAIIEAARARRHEVILQVVVDNGAQMNAVNVATSLHRLGSCGLPPGGREAARLLADPRFGRLLRMAGQHLSSFAAREVANCLWALAKLGYTHQQLLHCDGRCGAAALAPRQHRQLAGSLHDTVAATAVATESSRINSISSGCGGRPEGCCCSGGTDGGGGATSSLLEGLCARAEATLGSFGAQEVAVSLWALGAMGHRPGAALLRGLTQRLLEVLDGVTPQNVSNSLLGLAKLGWSPGAAWLDRVARGSVDKVGAFEPQALSNTLWALARLGHRHEALQTAMYQQALRSASGFAPQGISNLLWAAATLETLPNQETAGAAAGAAGAVDTVPTAHAAGAVPELLLRRFCDQAVGALQSFAPQNLSNLMWATAKLGYRHEPLLGAVAGAAARQLAFSSSSPLSGGEAAVAVAGGRSWHCQELSNATWAYATLGVQPGSEYLRQVCGHLSRWAARYKWQELANTVWALAALHHYDKSALQAVEAEVVARTAAAIPDGEGQRWSSSSSSPRPLDVSTLLRSYAALQHPAPELFAALLPRLASDAALVSEADLLDSLCAAATLGAYDDRVLDILAEHLLQHRLHRLQPHQLAQVAWAYGELRHAHRALFDGIVARAAAAFVSSPNATAAASLSAPAAAGLSSRRLLLAVPHLARIACAAGIFGWRYPQLVEGAAGALDRLHRHRAAYRPCSDDGEEEGTVAAADADADADADAAGRIRISGGKAARRRQRLELELELLSTVWGLSLVGGCSPSLWAQMVQLLLVGWAVEKDPGDGRGGEDDGVGGLPEEALRQLYQTYLHVQWDNPTAALLPPAPAQLAAAGLLLGRAAEAWRLRARWGGQVSSLQREVSDALGRLGLGHEVERLVEGGDFAIDLAIELPAPVQRKSDGGGAASVDQQWQQWQQWQGAAPGIITSTIAGSSRDVSKSGGSSTTRPALRPGVLLIAVEVDGPWHFTANTLQPLATTTYRRRCLEARGWTVVSVPYWSWYGIRRDDPRGQEALLLQLLQEAGLGEIGPLQQAALAQKQPALYRRRR